MCTNNKSTHWSIVSDSFGVNAAVAVTPVIVKLALQAPILPDDVIGHASLSLNTQQATLWFRSHHPRLYDVLL